ncbi:hypothetical protein TVAG_019370 [Trichomonas vaginalis G3]|uniref:Uncharacterized protein n=1 Tax=Trichomonas vaginalis (strain ATCC PRA-98 / G3) TaxID=412133 RepID=A2DX10_TRIV3|nr:hypothetical protein TVAGG3_0185010 [Trichomonas vaginalis G3]EAY15037.1 hypothetical protein TVAG_019370 [Trichomonas vaginalis G3]KAI5549578.1 hypothetical protein TVAGG3_0185010 [Trichomonas vaginalis G3]|eukprot:XP_001327260.1 hypothetical protein [Trichomonas vaginalis G3]
MSVSNIVDLARLSCENGINNFNAFDLIKEILLSILDTDSIPSKFNCSLNDFLDKHCPKIVERLLGAYCLNEELADPIFDFLKEILLIFEKHFHRLNDGYIKSVCLIVSSLKCNLFKSFKKRNFHEELIQVLNPKNNAEQINDMIKDADEQNLHKISLIFSIISQINFTSPSFKPILTFIDQTCLSEKVNPDDLTRIYRSLIKILPDERESITKLFVKSSEHYLNTNVKWIITNIQYFKVDNIFMKKIIDQAPNNMLLELVNCIDSYDDDVKLHLFKKTLNQNSIQSWSCHLDKFFFDNFDSADINESNYKFMMFALRNSEIDQKDKYFKKLQSYVSYEDDFNTLQALFPDQSLKNFVDSFSRLKPTEIYSIIENNFNNIDIDLSTVVQNTEEEDLEKLIQILPKLSSESIRKLENYVLSLKFTENRLKLEQKIHEITKDEEIIKKICRKQQ